LLATFIAGEIVGVNFAIEQALAGPGIGFALIARLPETWPIS